MSVSIREADVLLDNGHTEAALMVARACLERAIRDHFEEWAPEEIGLNVNKMLKRLVQKKRLSGTKSKQIASVYQALSRVAHGRPFDTAGASPLLTSVYQYEVLLKR